ncbi:unnamed protein product [Phaedon cochleariae]|uniref:RING-type domain-containing protein n=1 Tax=Phaedon cochleariae TaxID=80249 RepID=A0A9N9SL28_PHACE|nr:unnamed protein product [Phaedon cochleariae]
MAELLELQNKLVSMKCCLCNNFLSVPPIMVLSKNGKQSKCGRCKNNNEKPSICRNFTFENVAMDFSFPCIYKDCNEMIPWKEVESHEDACDKKTIKCPIYYQKCEGIFQVRNLEEHCKRYHEKNIYYETFNYSIKASATMISFVLYDNYQFITTIATHNGISEINVAFLKKINDVFTYDLQLISTRNDTFVTYKNQPTSKYDERNHHHRCIIYSECERMNGYPHAEVRDNAPVDILFKKVVLVAVKSLFGDISRYRIKIVPNKEYRNNNKETSSDTAKIENPKNEVNIVDECLEKLKRQFLCPICMEYMVDKIYNCEKGHVLCKNCKVQLTECPSCRIKLGEARCFPLENLADEVVLACLYSKNGCEFTEKLKLLSQHEKECVHKQD